MDRLLQMDVEAYVTQLRAEIEMTLRQVGEAVNNAPTGNVISGSEVPVRDALRQFGKRAFEQAVQMRIDSTESSFFPSAGCEGASARGQGEGVAQHQHSQRPD